MRDVFKTSNMYISYYQESSTECWVDKFHVLFLAGAFNFLYLKVSKFFWLNHQEKKKVVISIKTRRKCKLAVPILEETRANIFLMFFVFTIKIPPTLPEDPPHHLLHFSRYDQIKNKTGDYGLGLWLVLQ